MQRGYRRSTGPEFDRLLVESVHESFALILGEIPKRALYASIERNYAVAISRVPERLDDFAEALETLFGVPASRSIARVIVKRLYSELGLTYIERPDWRLPDYVNEAKSRMTLCSGPYDRSLTFEDLARR
jgi:hypothetical protein